jgi:hypothetical protein
MAGPGKGIPQNPRFADIGIDFLAVVVSRAAMFVLLYLASRGHDDDSIARGLVLIYGLSTILYLATWASTYRSSHKSPVGFLLFFQFLVELLVEAALFYSNDGYLSDYGLLFILTILSAGLFFQFWGSFAMATLATIIHGYAGGMHLGLPGPVEIALPRLLLETVQTRFFLFASLFYLVALLSSLLSRKLIAARKELEGTQGALDRYQFSAESMMNDLPTGLLFFDPAGFLKYRNPLCEEWLERPLEVGMPREAILQGLIGEDILRAMERMGETFPVKEMEIEAPSGRPLHIQIKVITRGEEHLGLVFTLMDFTCRRASPMKSATPWPASADRPRCCRTAPSRGSRIGGCWVSSSPNLGGWTGSCPAYWTMREIAHQPSGKSVLAKFSRKSGLCSKKILISSQTLSSSDSL